MTDTVTTPPSGAGDDASGDLTADLPGGLSGGLRGLDSRGVVDLILERRRAADRAEADLLAGVVHYVDLHLVMGDCDEAAGDVLPTSGPAGMLPPR